MSAFALKRRLSLKCRLVCLMLRKVINVSQPSESGSGGFTPRDLDLRERICRKRARTRIVRESNGMLLPVGPKAPYR